MYNAYLTLPENLQKILAWAKNVSSNYTKDDILEIAKAKRTIRAELNIPEPTAEDP